MNFLLRDLAPIPQTAWEEIDEEARRVLKLTLAARKLVDFTGPLGWSTSAIDIGRADPLKDTLVKGVEPQLRKMQPMLELRVPFELQRSEMEAIRRGAKDADLEPVTEAAQKLAMAEDKGLLEKDTLRIRPTRHGRLFLNDLLQLFLD